MARERCFAARIVHTFLYYLLASFVTINLHPTGQLSRTLQTAHELHEPNGRVNGNLPRTLTITPPRRDISYFVSGRYTSATYRDLCLFQGYVTLPMKPLSIVSSARTCCPSPIPVAPGGPLYPQGVRGSPTLERCYESRYSNTSPNHFFVM